VLTPSSAIQRIVQKGSAVSLEADGFFLGIYRLIHLVMSK
jgi:hypothetical protein